MFLVSPRLNSLILHFFSSSFKWQKYKITLDLILPLLQWSYEHNPTGLYHTQILSMKNRMWCTNSPLRYLLYTRLLFLNGVNIANFLWSWGHFNSVSARNRCELNDVFWTPFCSPNQSLLWHQTTWVDSLQIPMWGERVGRTEDELSSFFSVQHVFLQCLKMCGPINVAVFQCLVLCSYTFP